MQSLHESQPFRRISPALQQLDNLTFPVLPKNSEDEPESGTQWSRLRGHPPKSGSEPQAPGSHGGDVGAAAVCGIHFEDQEKATERGREMLRFGPTK